jgi:phage shock protein PspC (stress-responsive transcriptional regulator)
MTFNEKLKALRRSKHDRMIAGICGGFANSTDTPSWVWRAGFPFTTIWAGTGGLLYLILWYFMPQSDDIT